MLAQKRAGPAKSGRVLTNALASVRTDAKAIPKFDIGVPVHHEKWNPKETTPLVAFHHRQEIDDTELERIKAYDAEGNVHWLDAQDAPDEPVVVVGVNERTTASGEVRTAYQDVESKQCIEIKSTAKCGGGGGGGGTGGGGSSEDPREYGDHEYLERVKVTDDRENWHNGDPELKLEARSQGDGKLKLFSLHKREGSTANPFNSDDKSWNTHDTFYFA